MDRVVLAESAEEVLEAHKGNLLLDPYIKISIEVVEGEFTSICVKDSAALSWILKLNPERHEDLYDIQLSVVEGLLVILFDDLDLIGNSGPEVRKEIQKRIISRLSAAFCSLFEEELDTEEEEEPNEED